MELTQRDLSMLNKCTGIIAGVSDSIKGNHFNASKSLETVIEVLTEFIEEKQDEFDNEIKELKNKIKDE